MIDINNLTYIIMKKKIYGVYFAYDASEFLPYEMDDAFKTNYPSELARISKYASKGEQLDAFANTMCSASQCITADSEKEFQEKVRQIEANFDDPEWVKVNIDPYC